MKLEEAIHKLELLHSIKFKDLFTDNELINIIIAKGDTGKLLEKLIGLPPGNTLKDFEDGELKTNKVNSFGNPMETMFISQISSHVDDLLNQKQFEETWLRNKIERILYVPVVKIHPDPQEWFFLRHSYVEINLGEVLYSILKSDYEAICDKMIHDIEHNDGNLHTSSGKYIQIRTKDAMPYNPIFSRKYNKFVSNKNFAFYFKKEFMRDITLYSK
ncbi:MAG: MutH/Sau3AI family endonuclease [Methanobacterium sp.]